MQLSTNRVNFTSSSVAQINYVEFLNKSRTTKKGVQDIVTILGLHTDEAFSYNTQKKTKLLWQRSVTRCLKNKYAVMAYVPLKSLKINFEKTLRWFQYVFLYFNQGEHKIAISCDMKMAIIKIDYCCGGQNESLIFIIKTKKVVSNNLKVSFGENLFKCEFFFIYFKLKRI